MSRRFTPVLVGIAGPSGSGKTTLAQTLAGRTGAVIFPADHYYCDLSHLPLAQRAQQNFDHPDAIESELLTEHVGKLAEGLPIERPVYDFSLHTRTDVTEKVLPSELIIVEGLFTLHYQTLRRLLHLKIFIDAPENVCLERRLMRDTRERGRTATSVRQQFEETVQPMAAAFVLPSRAFADLIVSGTAACNESVTQIMQELARRK